MRAFKFLSIFIFLAVFINSKADAPTRDFEGRKDHSSKIIKDDQKINTDDQDDDSAHKRKLRPRGTEVDVPQISEVSFEHPFIYEVFKPLFIEKSYSSFLYCIPLKRGPPLA